MNNFLHYFVMGMAIGLGLTIPMATWMFLDRFMADLNWKFWQWKRKEFK